MERLRIKAALQLAGDRLDAADVLASAPHRAESGRVLARGLLALEEAAALLEATAGSPLLSVSELQGLSELRRRLEAAPETDAQLSRADLHAHRAARRLALRVQRQLRRASRSEREINAQRAAWLVAAVAVVAAGVFLLSLRDRFEVSASSRFSGLFNARNAIDGNDGTEWLAPDGAAAWLELSFKKPIAVTAVRVLNARNAPYDDRATKDLDVSLFAGAKKLEGTTLTLPGLDSTEKSRTIPIVASGVTRVRFLARTHYGKGAGLAEVEVVEAGK